MSLPKPYYQDEWVQIFHGDCRGILPQLPDKSVGLVLTDPPYNVKKDYGEYKDNLRMRLYRELISWLRSQIKEKSDGKAVFILGSYGKILLEWWQLFPEAKLIIVKMGAISRNTQKNMWLQYHPVLTTVPSNRLVSDLWEDIRWPGEGYFFNELRFGHPAMTPEKLARKLVGLFSQPLGTIIDPFLGCGTIAVASKLLNRYCLGIEMEEKYCEIAANRCRQMVLNLGI